MKRCGAGGWQKEPRSRHKHQYLYVTINNVASATVTEVPSKAKNKKDSPLHIIQAQLRCPRESLAFGINRFTLHVNNKQ